jgi:mRNA interferase MazF
MIQRGDLVTVALQGDFGKPRPALVVQTDLLSELDSVIVCPVTSELRTAAFRVTLEPSQSNGLKALSQVMADKITTVSRAKLGTAFGRVEEDRMRLVDRCMLLVLGIV